MDWASIYRRMVLDAPAGANATRQSSGYAADYGFTTSVAANRRGSASGLSTPPMKAFSQDPAVLGGTVMVGAAADSIQPQWRRESKYSALVRQSPAVDFCERLGPKCVFPSTHVGVTGLPRGEGLPGLCKAHNDNLVNCKELQDVVCISIVVGDYRMSVNCQQRKSITDFYKKKEEQGPLLESLEGIFADLPFRQKFISEDLFNGDRIEYFPGFTMIRNSCNANPIGHSQPVLDMIVRLSLHYSLSTLEIFRLQYAAQCVSHTTMMFWTAGVMLLQLPKRGVDQAPGLPSSCRGWGFGYLLLRVQVALYNDLRGRNIKHQFRRFNRYIPVVVEERRLFEKQCHHLASLTLHQWAADPNGASSEKRRTANYAGHAGRHEKLSGKGQGHLANTHAILQESSLGLSPRHNADECIINDDAKYIQHINKEFKLSKPMKKEAINQLFGTVRQRFRVVFGMEITRRWFENYLCKWFRIYQATKHGRHLRWCDLLGCHQLLFHFTSDGFWVIEHTGEREFYEGSALISTFPYGRELLPMEEIVEEMGLPTTMPTMDRIADFNFEKHPRLCNPSASIGVQFHVPDLSPLTEEGVNTARRFLQPFLGSRAIPSPTRRSTSR